jgi:hypothetical protein
MSYRLITRDIDRSLARVADQPAVKRESDYFRANIGKVKSVDDFLADTRLFNYAMKAFGLSDMAYAKGFMKKVLTEGVTDPNSFANKLTDKRYAEFAKVFDFVAHGEETTTWNPARDRTMNNYIARATGGGALPQTETAKQETAYFLETIGSVESIDDLLNDPRLLDYALRAYRIEGLELSRTELARLLEDGTADPDSRANRHSDENVAKFVSAFDFARLGERTTSHVAAVDDTVSSYMRQSLEQDAGSSNEGVRLALYFERKAPEIASFYSILADPALAAVVRTALGLPESMAQADLDRQVAAMEKRLDIEDLQDPEKLGKFLTRFSAMWDVANNSATSSPAAILLSPSPGFGISADTLMAISTLKNR